ncbi:Sentrin-specific protease 1 [Geodia barretti]|nr:Sentrin-specific protease 1 [Geodia barretti]
MAELTEQQLQQVQRVLSRGSGLEVLSQRFNISIKRDDVMTLAGLNWLNDEVINFYMNLIMERGREEGSVCSVHVMSSFFTPNSVTWGTPGYGGGPKRWMCSQWTWCSTPSTSGPTGVWLPSTTGSNPSPTTTPWVGRASLAWRNCETTCCLSTETRRRQN